MALWWHRGCSLHNHEPANPLYDHTAWNFIVFLDNLFWHLSILPIRRFILIVACCLCLHFKFIALSHLSSSEVFVVSLFHGIHSHFWKLLSHLPWVLSKLSTADCSLFLGFFGPLSKAIPDSLTSRFLFGSQDLVLACSLCWWPKHTFCGVCS